jgi:hypothetical protein
MSGVLLEPRDGQLWLPDDTLWTPPAGSEHIPLERIVPRVCMIPGTASGFDEGRQAVELAASAGLILDPWEQLCIVLGLAETPAARWAAFTVALLVARQNGKGAILEALELYWLFIRGEALSGHSAHEYKTAMEGFRRLLWHIEANDWLRKRVKKVINTNGEEGIELLAGARLRFMARSKGAGRGFTFHKLIWDEGYALTAAQQDAQLPTMSAVDNPQIWITSSPPLDETAGEVLFRLRRIARSLGVKLTFLDYGAEGSLDNLEAVDLDDQKLWQRTNPSEVHAGSGHGVSLEYMEGERTNMSDEGFARERLGIWPPDLTEGFGVITADQWARMLDPYSGTDEYEKLPATMEYWPDPSLPADDPRYQIPPTRLMGRPVIALAVSPRNPGGVKASVGLASGRFDGKRHIEVVARQSGTAWVIPWLRTFLAATPTAAIVIDPGSPAGSLLADVETLVTELGLTTDIIVKMTAQSVASAFGMIYDAAQESEPSVVHLDQAELKLAVGGAVTREVGGTGGKAWDARNGTTDITTLVGVTYALWGLAQPGVQEADAEPLVVWA